MRKYRIFALVTALALTLTGVFASVSSSTPITGRDWVATPNGLVGVQQMVIVRAPRQAGKMAVVSFENASAGNNTGEATINSQGFAYLPWQPGTPGTWKISSTVGGLAVGTTSISVAAMPTKTVLMASGQVRENRSTTLVAQVRAVGGEIIPSGTVRVRNQFSAIVASGVLSPTTTPGLASANIAWTPSAGAVSLTATYTPETASFGASISPAVSPTVGDGQAVALRLPPVSYVGVAETIEAVIQPESQSPLGGSVAFILSTQGFFSYPMGGSQSIGDGVGSATWTPTQAGVQNIRVEYASANFAINANNTQAINVLPAPTPDGITITPAGAGAWGPGLVGTLTAGNSVGLTPTSSSGNPVTLSTDGPCAMNAGTVTVLGPGQCIITSTSLGDGGSLAASSSTYLINVLAAPKKQPGKKH